MGRDNPQELRIVDALYRVNNFLSCVNDLHHLMELIMEESKDVLYADASSLMLYDSATEELYFEVALGDKGDAVKEIRVPISQGIAGACARERKIIVVPDCSKDPRHFKFADQKSHFETKNILAAPMVRNEKLIGVLEVLNKKNDLPWTEEDEKVLDFFSSQAAIAIENAQLIQANIQAERLAAVGQAVAGISHYIKNVLAGMKGGSGLINLGLEKQEIGIIKEAWPILERANKKINDLVQDMLTYSKAREPELSKVNINNLLKDITKLCEETAKKNDVSIILNLDKSISDSMLDQNRITDAILNIVSNAIDALLKVPNAHVNISTKLDAKENKLDVVIEDNGCGIPQTAIKKIFDPFFSTKGSKGTGLGLAVTKKVIEEHKGRITVFSEEKRGTKFVIMLPYIKAD